MTISIHRKRLALFMVILIPSLLISSDKINHLPSSADLFHNFGQNLLHSFNNSYGLYHVAASGLSYGLVKSGADWKYYRYMQDNPFIPRAGFVSVISGGLVPLTVPFYAYFTGKSKQDAKLMYTGLALGQAVISGLLVSSTYKAVSGRDAPETFEGAKKRNDYSDQFHFGFMRRGIFDGWPSGHTTNAFAMASVLWEMYPENNQLKFYSGVYAFVIGLGVSTNIHWFSDFVAGALIGYSVGKSIGQSFKNLMDGRIQDEKISFILTPRSAALFIRF